MVGKNAVHGVTEGCQREVGRTAERNDLALALDDFSGGARNFRRYAFGNGEHAMGIAVQQVSRLHFQAADFHRLAELDEVSIGM